MVVYVPQGGGGGGGSGAVIDAYNESTGSLVDNDFVSVSPDPGGTLTTEANVDGWVDTTSAGYTITADHPNIGPYGGLSTAPLFDQWVVLENPTPPPSLVSGASLTPGKGQTVYALAFYKTPMKSGVIDKVFIKEHKEAILEGPSKSIVAEGPIKGIKEQVEIPGLRQQSGRPRLRRLIQAERADRQARGRLARGRERFGLHQGQGPAGGRRSRRRSRRSGRRPGSAGRKGSLNPGRVFPARGSCPGAPARRATGRFRQRAPFVPRWGSLRAHP